MVKKSLLVCLLGITPVLSFGQPQIVDSRWEEVRPGIWERHLGGVGGQATLTIVQRGNALTYSVTRPCFFHPDRQYTIQWKPGATFGRGTSCLDEPYREHIEAWLPEFSASPVAAR